MYCFDRCHTPPQQVPVDLLTSNGPHTPMEIIYLLISVSLLVALIFLGAFLWSVRSGQFDDSYGSSVRLLHDDDNDPKTQS